MNRPAKPKAARPNFAAMPAALKARRQWVVWRYVWKSDAKLPNGGKWDKPPLTINGRPASSTDAQTWASFAEAAAAFQQGVFDGVGFVTSDADPIFGVDLDDKEGAGVWIDTNGELTDAARALLDPLATYTETSPSGRGLRAFAYGILPPGARRKGAIELYEKGRYFTVTGNWCADYPADLQEREAAAADLHRRYIAPEPKPTPPRRMDTLPPGVGFTESDTDLLHRATNAKNGAKFAALYAGVWQGAYPSQSEADAALCELLAFYTGPDAGRVDCLFRASGLFRDKWDEARGAQTYGERTVQKALAGRTEYYTPLTRNNQRGSSGSPRVTQTPGAQSNPQTAGTGEGGTYKTYTTDMGSRSVGFVGSPPDISPDFHNSPARLTVDLLPVQRLTVDMLPPVFQASLNDIARRVSCPLEFAAAPALIAVSAVVGRKIGIRPKQYDDWTVVPNLWGAIVGPPGALKTPAVAEALRPLHRLEADARAEYASAVKQHETSKMVAEARGSAAKDELRKAAKEGKTPAELAAIIGAAAADTDAPPIQKRLTGNDMTQERLGELLRDNPNGLLLHRDELTGFLRTLDKQGHESDRAFYLEAWNGSGAFTVDRIGRGTVFIPALCLSLFGTIQPGPLARYIRAGAEEADGFPQRLQVLVYPDPPRQFVNVDRWPDADAKQAAFDVFKRLYNLNPAEAGGQTDGNDSDPQQIPFLRFTPDAQAFFNKWRTDLENRLLTGGDAPAMQSHLAKYRSLMPSLALLFHLIEGRGGLVDMDAASLAARWCNFLESHARRIYHAATDTDPDAAFALAGKLKQTRPDKTPVIPNPFTYREIVQKGWGGLDTTEAVTRAVSYLQERDWLQIVEEPAREGERPGGRPSVKIWINPLLRTGAGISEKPTDMPEAGTYETYETNETARKPGFVGFAGSEPVVSTNSAGSDLDDLSDLTDPFADEPDGETLLDVPNAKKATASYGPYGGQGPGGAL